MYQTAGLEEHRPAIENSLMSNHSKHGNAGAWEGTRVIVLRIVYFPFVLLCMKERRQLGGVSRVVGVGIGRREKSQSMFMNGE